MTTKAKQLPSRDVYLAVLTGTLANQKLLDEIAADAARLKRDFNDWLNLHVVDRAIALERNGVPD